MLAIPDLDAETLADTLEGITDLREMLAELIRSALEDEALASGLSTRLNDMKARLERLETRAGRKRQLALRAMSEADIQKLMESDFTASLKQGAPTLDVVDEAKVPAAYWKPSRRSSTDKDCWWRSNQASRSRASRLLRCRRSSL